ncbi:MAG TPA: phosphoenolpyruvate synthase regulatory protein [Rhodospirillaceae bacterium]|nr:phosphoenolpyruvate synthase regulatory protein [Rhodospirillaceae bacterium]
MGGTQQEQPQQPKLFYLHLISDATGTTLLGLARACIAQFEGIEPVQKFWPLIRTQKQLDRVIMRIEANPGPVIMTLVDDAMRQRLAERCDQLGVPCVSVLDPVIRGLSSFLGINAKGVPGLQHTMDDAYFQRISALDYAMRHDDGRNYQGLEDADVILVGVSRTSKTPTSIYLARRGIKTANIPLVPNVRIPDEVFAHKRPLYVGLTESAQRLLQVRRNRLKAGDEEEERHYHIPDNEYLDEEKIEEEVRKARRFFTKQCWPVIDVTKRSIEETAAEVMGLLQAHRERINGGS